MARNLKLGLKLSVTQQICVGTKVASCFEPYLDPSVHCGITGKISATYFSSRAALFTPPLLSASDPEGALPPAEGEG